MALDSGSGNHLRSRDKLTKEERGTLRRAERPLRLATANGIIQADERIDLPLPGFNDPA